MCVYVFVSCVCVRVYRLRALERSHFLLVDDLSILCFRGNALAYDARDARTILAAGSIIQDHNDNDVALIKYRVAAVGRWHQ
jgi:hypothetical protein